MVGEEERWVEARVGNDVWPSKNMVVVGGEEREKEKKGWIIEPVSHYSNG